MEIIFFLLTIITMMILIMAKILGITATFVGLKGLASVFFIATGIASYHKVKRNKKYCIWILLGLIFSLGGDIFMELSKAQGILFVSGIGSFAIAHIMYSIGFCSLKKITGKDILLFITIVTPFILILKFGGFEYDGLQLVVIGYTLLISFMVSKAISIHCYYKGNEKAVVMTILGTVMFLVSDIILLFSLFSKFNYTELTYVNLLFYYIGQGVLALSLREKLAVDIK